MLAVSNSVKNTMINFETVMNSINHFINHGHPQLPPRGARWVIAASLCSPENHPPKSVGGQESLELKAVSPRFAQKQRPVSKALSPKSLKSFLPLNTYLLLPKAKTDGENGFII